MSFQAATYFLEKAAVALLFAGVCFANCQAQPGSFPPEKSIRVKPARDFQINPAAFRTTRYGVENGLSQGSNYCMLQDSRGFRWFSSLEGLNRFDGSRFRVYREAPSDTNSLCGNKVTGIVEDKLGNLWIGTEKCLNRYMRRLDRFEKCLPASPDQEVTESRTYPFFADSSQVWYINDSEGIVAFNFRQRKKRVLTAEVTYGRNEGIINSTRRTPDGFVWTRQEEGLVRLNPTSGSLDRYFSSHPKNVLGTPLAITSFFVDAAGRIWLGIKKGVLLFLPEKADFQFFNCEDFFQGYVADIGESWDGTLWLGTSFEGIFTFRPAEGILHHFRSDDSGRGLANNSAATLFMDAQQIVWVNSDPEGVCKITPAFKSFRLYNHNLFPKKDFPSPGVRCFAGGGGKVWMGMQEGGVCRFDPAKEQLDVFINQQNFPAFRDNHARCLLQDGEGRLWIGATEGLYQFQPAAKKLQRILLPAGAQGASTITDLLQMPDGAVFFTTESGVFFIEAGSLKPRRLAGLQDKVYGKMFLDRSGRLFLAELDNGLHFFEKSDLTTRRFLETTPQHCLPRTNVKCFGEANPGGSLWLGTTKGLLKTRFNPMGLLVVERNFTTEDGLPSNTVYGILPQKPSLPKEKEEVWLSTNRGISKFEIANGGIQNFTPHDGLQSYEFNTNAFFATASGELYFGGVQGFNRFFPAHIGDNPHPPGTPQILTCSVNGQPFDEQGYVGELEKLTLRHDQNTFFFEFSALDYLSESGNFYRVKLEGYDKNWVELGSNHDIRYTQVPSGKYLLKVKTANSDKRWSDSEQQLSILVMPPWWANWWACAIYVLLLSAAAFAIYKMLKRRWLLQNQLQWEHAETLRLQELDALKTRLYTNITHEFRTPLTIISGMAEEMKLEIGKLEIGEIGKLEIQSDSPISPISNFCISSLDMIKRNSQSLLRLVNQMLDLSKIESGNMPLHLVQGDVVGYLKYIVESFHSLAEAKNIRLEMRSDLPELVMDFDEEKLLQIVSNLLSNAIKFTPAGGEVALRANHGDFKNHHDLKKHLHLTVSDNGIGIPPEKLPRIFDRFYQADDEATRHAEGTGIGLTLTKELVKLLGGKISVKSEAGKGTTFEVRLPVNRKAVSVHVGATLAVAQVATVAQELLPNTDGRPRGSPLLLLIEDNPDVVRYLAACLETDYRLDVARNGKEGVDRATETIPDLIISDVMMPEMDGFEVCRTLKKDERTSHVPIILLTAKADLSSKIEGLEQGADAYLAKPFDKEELLVRIRKLLELRQKMQQHYRAIALAPAVAPPAEKEEEIVLEMENAFVLKVRAIVEKHLNDSQFDLAHFSREAAMSASQLHRKLVAVTGLSPNRFIRHLRLTKAKTMLLETEETVSAIAYESGFTDPDYFIRAFRQEFGMPPAAFKKQVLINGDW